MPQLGETVTEGTVAQWLKKVGDTVEKYEPFVEVATDKVSAEIPATYLQDHENCLMVLDRAAAGGLTRIQTPWLVAPLEESGLA